MDELMTFTDDDLKRLKENNEYHKTTIRSGYVPLASDLCDALLARLEAAEKLADAQRSLAACTQEDFDTSDGDGYVLQELVKEKEEAWRKAAGK
jgi:predicted component of type VI protein secretion system